MSNHPPAAWLADWRQAVNAAADALLAGFEERFGYPAGENAVDEPDDDGLAAAEQLAAHPAVAPPLPHFYRHIGGVVLSDVGNAYFIHTAAQVRRDLAESGPIPLGPSGPGAFFASDGGGIHFVIAADGTIHRSVAASRHSDFHPVADDLQDFLEQLRRAVVRFVETGRPGDL
jgi:hypothetical protein